jgi:hypothetical protein
MAFLKHYWRNCEIIFSLLLWETISSMMFQICFWASVSWDLVFEISKIIQNFDHKYISGHVLPCTQNRHFNSNSTHCAPLVEIGLRWLPKHVPTSTCPQAHLLLHTFEHLLKSNFLSSQMDSHSSSPSYTPIDKAKWVQLNDKTLQVLKKSLFLRAVLVVISSSGSFETEYLGPCSYLFTGIQDFQTN